MHGIKGDNEYQSVPNKAKRKRRQMKLQSPVMNTRSNAVVAKRGAVEPHVILLGAQAEPPRGSLSPVVQSARKHLRSGGIETPEEPFETRPRAGLLMKARDECTLCHGTLSVIVGTSMESQRPTKTLDLNVLGLPLEPCCFAPQTGFYRDGYCRTGPQDSGRHIVCAEVTLEFLEFSQAAGNDLSTPMPAYGFPGLRAGDRWCLCALRWKEAFEAGCAPPVILEACNQRVLELISLEALQAHAL